MPAVHAHELDITTASESREMGVAGADLIVMGEKSDRSLQDTPTSVAITTSRSIDDQNLLTVYDILDRSPNVMVDGNHTTFSIRGIDAFNVSGGGDGALASVYVDGATIPRLALSSGPLDLYDVAQVEVLRGPQSTIQGRNALAGTVIINTIDPSFDWTGKARLLLTNQDGQKRAGIVIGGPIVDDQFAFRLAGEASDANGLLRNVTTHTDADQRRSEMLRGKLLLIPSALPSLRIVGAFLYDRHQRGAFYSEFDPPYNPRQRITIADIQDIKRVGSSIGTLAVSYEMGAGSILKSVTNYSHIRFRSLSDANRTVEPGEVSHIDDLNRSFQQEVRFNFHRNWVDGLIGAFYLRERRAYFYTATQSLSLVSLGVDRQLQAVGLPPTTVNAVLDLYGGLVPINNSLSQPKITDNYAGFVDLTFPLANRVRLHFGVRYDIENQDRSATQIISIDRPLPDPANLPVPVLAPIVGQLNSLLYSLAQGASSVEPVHRASYQAWLPKLGLTYDLAKNVALSLVIQRGYRAGGSGFNEQRAQSYDYEPEYITNYECAVRSTWFHERVTLNVNAYRTDWKDQQVLVQLTPGSIYDTQVVNAGKSRLYGFEIETHSTVTKTFNLYAGIGFSNARFRDFTVNVGTPSMSAQEKEFPRAPRWTLSGGAAFSHPSGWSANVQANHRAAYYQDVMNQSVRDIPGRTLVNAKLGWQGQHFSAFVVATNIFNVQKPGQFFRDVDGRRRGTLNDPRIIGLSLESRI